MNRRKPLIGRSGGSSSLPARDRRDSQAAAQGDTFDFPLRTNRKGRVELVRSEIGGIGVDPSRGVGVIVHEPLQLAQGSPFGITLPIEKESMVIEKGKLAARLRSDQIPDVGGTVALQLTRLRTNKENKAEKSAPNGYASLDSGVLVPVAELGTGVADATTFLRGDRTWATPASGTRSRAHHDFAHPGSDEYEAWFVVNATTHAPFGIVTLTRNTWFAVPFVAPERGGVIDGIGINVDSGGGDVQFGLWSDSLGFPSALVADLGIASLAAGPVFSAVSQSLQPGALYHVAITFDSGADLLAIDLPACSTAYGYLPDLATPTCFLEANTGYDVPPDPFPAGSTVTGTGFCPAIFVHFSA